jgi:hypothetical protein
MLMRLREFIFVQNESESGILEGGPKLFFGFIKRGLQEIVTFEFWMNLFEIFVILFVFIAGKP